ncbi:unnamed protein product [Spirodela intermedia]|uniref:PRONE domain-containing protein n=1 Tax=Spirodela intermedia TaxID=51605 RepID=A0A7I8JPN7_SPIIN|nr:unnamed protein product [Spirodela intermedia]CAA6672080.1 unnamed protein product [Spirodela intermedia]
MRTLACCHRAREISLDFDQADPRVTTYSGLESCILNHGGYSCGTEYSASQASDSQVGDELSCSSSSKGRTASPRMRAARWRLGRREEPLPILPRSAAPRSSEDKDKVPIYSTGFADVESMKEKFARLLLGEDGSGGRRGVATAVALSNAISNLAGTVADRPGFFLLFRVHLWELWKLEPLPEEKKSKWRREMDWLLSPTNYMVELVPGKQTGANIMTPRARADVHTTLPALQKLDSILVEVLDSMVETEFWYAEGRSRTAEKAAQGGGGGGGGRPGKRWWLPSPGKKLGFQGKCVYQVMKAVKSINEQILLQIPLPDAIRDALPKSGKVGMGEDLERLVSSELCSVEDIFRSLDLSSEHGVLDIVNRLEGAAFAWRERLSGGVAKKGRRAWAAIARDGGAKPVAKIGVSLERVGALLYLLRDRFPNLPQTFFAVAKIRSNKDVGHAIVEAYSRVLGNLAFCILTRIGDVLQEDDLHQPISTADADLKFELSSEMYLSGAAETPPGYIKRALIDQMDMADGRLRVADVIRCPWQLFPEKKIADVFPASLPTARTSLPW